eukprot:209656_1
MSTEESSQIYIELLDKTIELHKKWFTFINDINNDTINNETQTIILTNQQNNDRINNSIQIKQEFDDEETETQDKHINTIQNNKKKTTNDNLIEHNDKKPWKCNKCNHVSYKTSQELTRHNNRIHSVKFKCKYCDKTWGSDRQLKRHEKVHTNERPFDCHYNNCNKAFKRNSTLIQHINEVHKKLKPFKCNECDKGYATNSDLTQHINSIHKELA